MRVISGTAKRIQLNAVEGIDTRPTLDRQKETLFNVIQFDLFESMCMDLYAGSGSIGIEALSRGASKVYFVENKMEAFEVIKENLNKTKLKEGSVVLLGEVLQTIPKMKNEKFDLIFMDPPYDQGLELKTIAKIMEYQILNDSGKIIVESSIKTDLSEIESMGLRIESEKKFKINKLSFIVKATEV